jgi:hypothetical protein
MSPKRSWTTSGSAAIDGVGVWKRCLWEAKHLYHLRSTRAIDLTHSQLGAASIAASIADSIADSVADSVADSSFRYSRVRQLLPDSHSLQPRPLLDNRPAKRVSLEIRFWD